MKNSGLPLSLLAAALVAALVSLGVTLMGRPAETSSAPPEASSRVMALEATVARLTSQMATQTQRVATALKIAHAAEERAAAVRTWAGGGMRANAAKVTGLEGAQSTLATAFERVNAEARGLQGRIESNYVNVRALTKRVKALEAR